MASVFYFPLIGTPTADGYQLSFYEAGTDVPLDVWSSPDLDVAWSQPIILNAAGNSDGPIYVSPSPAYKVVYETDLGVAVPGYPVDFVSPSTIVNVTTVSTTVLTNAQIKALPTTPITVVAAPASGLRVKPLGASFRTNFAAGAYTGLNTTYAALTLYYSGTSGTWATTALLNDSTTTFSPITRLTDAFGTQPKVTDVIPYHDAPSELATLQWVTPTVLVTANTNGIALVVAIDNNGSGNLGGGNAANTMTVTVYYVLESLA